MDVNEIDKYLKTLYQTSGTYTYSTGTSSSPMVTGVDIPVPVINDRETWFWEPTDSNFLETENMATYKGDKIVSTVRQEAEISKKDEMIAFKKQLKINIENKDYPSEYLNNDIQYYLKHTKDKHFNLGIYKPAVLPWLGNARYCPIFGVWDKFDLKNVLMIKDRTIPRKSAIRLSFRAILESPVGDLRDKGTDQHAALEIGDYIWSFDHMYAGQMRILFKKIMASKAANKVEWAEYFQNRILSMELDFGKKVKRSSRKGSSYYTDDEILLAPKRTSFETDRAERLVRSTPRSYDIIIKEVVEGLPLGKYRWVRGYEHRRLENQLGQIWAREDSRNSWHELIKEKGQVVKRPDGLYQWVDNTGERGEPAQEDPR